MRGAAIWAAWEARITEVLRPPPYDAGPQAVVHDAGSLFFGEAIWEILLVGGLIAWIVSS